MRYTALSRSAAEKVRNAGRVVRLVCRGRGSSPRRPTPSGEPNIPFDYAGEDQRECLYRGATELTENQLGLGVEDPDGPAIRHFTRDDLGGALGMRTDQGRYYYLTDQLGSVIALTDAQGGLTGRYRYEPYGKPRTEPASGPDNPIRFAGQELDRETGLYKMGFRYYDPGIGRFTQEDPLNLFQDPRQANRYAYAGADPVNKVDPTGAYCGAAGYDAYRETSYNGGYGLGGTPGTSCALPTGEGGVPIWAQQGGCTLGGAGLGALLGGGIGARIGGGVAGHLCKGLVDPDTAR